MWLGPLDAVLRLIGCVVCERGGGQVEKCGRVLMESGDLQAKRREQGRYWMWNSLQVGRRAL